MPEFFESILSSESNRICVIAAPGSGKTTRILIPKTTRLLEAGAQPNEILLLTFSRLSAIDLRGKLGALARRPRASTVHSFCLAFLLSENNHAIRDRIGSIVLDFEKEPLLADIKLALGAHKRILRKELTKFSAGWATQPHDQVFEETDEERRFKYAITGWLGEHQAAMMEEIVYHAVELAESVPDAPFLRQARYVLVDEFQDLNQLEQKFIELLATNVRLLLVVGDPDQSIYSFKYAHPEGISNFAQTAGVEPHRSLRTGRCPSEVIRFARQLLEQSRPDGTDLPESLPTAVRGEVRFIRRSSQADEFDYVLGSIRAHLQNGVSPKQIFILVPRRKMAGGLLDHATTSRVRLGLPDSMNLTLAASPEFTALEQDRLLRLALVVNRESLLHLRAWLGLGDTEWAAQQIDLLKKTYGGIEQLLRRASAADFPRSKKARALCERIVELRAFLQQVGDDEPVVNEIVELLFPAANAELQNLREVLTKLREDDDTLQTLYTKFTDYVRSIPDDETSVRVMTLMGSKGLEAEHVYILGCNSGNIPGDNRSVYLSDSQHLNEQLRLLYVGFTRAKASLTVSWSQNIPYAQSKSHKTTPVRIVRHGGVPHAGVSLSPFLQDLRGVRWE